MIRFSVPTALLVATLGCAASAQTTLGAAVTDGNDLFTTSSIDSDFEIGGDMFGIRDRINAGIPGLPFAIADDSVSIFPPDPVTENPGDTLGIIAEFDEAPFFGVVDNFNLPQNPETGNDQPQQAVWTFDISGASNLGLSIDLAAMGDFETDDQFTFTYAIDGQPAVEVFDISFFDDVEGENLVGNYTMDSGAAVELNDPLFVGDTQLTNDFVTFTEEITGSGSELTFTFEAISNGSEAFAFRDLILTGTLGVVTELAGDFNGNGAVEQGDLDLVLGNWGQATTPASFVANTDGLADGVDQEELDAVLGNWGASSAPTAGSAVPEPASAALLAAGLGLLARRRRVA